MRSWGVLAVAALFCGLTTVARPAEAQTLNPVNGHYYQVAAAGSPGAGTWTGAFAAAQGYTHEGRTGHLVTITSAAEQEFVANLLVPYRTGGTETATTSVWLGARRNAGNPAVFEWITGEAFDYANWHPGQPDNVASEPYGEFFNTNLPGYPFLQTTWNDIDDDGQDYFQYGYVVEYEGTGEDTSAVPEPSAALLFLPALGVVALARKKRTA